MLSDPLPKVVLDEADLPVGEKDVRDLIGLRQFGQADSTHPQKIGGLEVMQKMAACIAHAPIVWLPKQLENREKVGCREAVGNVGLVSA